VVVTPELPELPELGNVVVAPELGNVDVTPELPELGNVVVAAFSAIPMTTIICDPGGTILPAAGEV